MSHALTIARDLGHPCLPAHFLLAVLDVRSTGPATETLIALGLNSEKVLAHLQHELVQNSADLEPGSLANPSVALLGLARGLALGSGRTEINHADIVLAIAHGSVPGMSDFWFYGIDPDDAISELEARQVVCPSTRPPLPSPPIVAYAPNVYIRNSKTQAVRQLLQSSFPLQAGSEPSWGEGASVWRPGFTYFWSDQALDIGHLIESMALDDSDVFEVPVHQSVENERGDR